MTTPARPLPTIAAVIYRRAGRLGVPDPDGALRTGQAFGALQRAFGQVGLIPRRSLFAALEALSDRQVEALARDVLPMALAEVGAHRAHRPLFRNHPRTVPDDTYAFFLQRLIASASRDPGVPCALDRDDRPGGLSRAPSVVPEGACAYGMFDPELFDGCPICHRRVGPQDAPQAPALQASRERLRWYRPLDLDLNPGETARALLRDLLASAAPLAPQDREDLRVLVTHLGPAALAELPDPVPQRETMAAVLGTLLTQPAAAAAVTARLNGQVRTATDLLRVLDAAGGGDASLTGVNRAAKLPRPLRRALLARLEALDERLLTEDLQRHPARWKKAAQTLHPFEFARRYPKVAVAFAALRGTVPGDDPLGALLLRAAARRSDLQLLPVRSGHRRTGPRAPVPDVTTIVHEAQRAAMAECAQRGDWGQYAARLEQHTARLLEARTAHRAGRAGPGTPHPPRVRFTGWAGQVEQALAGSNTSRLLALLAQRPGELGRRLDKALRTALAGGEGDVRQVQEAAVTALPHLNAPLLLLLRAHLEARHQPQPVRLVFPRRSPHSFALPDHRAVLPPAVTAPITEAITAELLARAARLSRFPAAVLDARLQDLPLPFAERETARALVTLARGAKLALPPGRFARLFVHWMEHDTQRVDLDLSAAFYDGAWRHVGTCDFTHLRFAGTGAVHSGDLTSAPAPAGASEFIDLDLARLEEAGVRYVVMGVLSYNNVPFEDMADAFAGYMLREHAHGPVFDARSVEQRFDLRGQQQVLLPLALDAAQGTLHWLDTTPRSRTLGEVAGHQVAAYHDAMGLAARRVIECAATRARPTLWDVAALHAAARCDEVVVQRPEGWTRHVRGHLTPEAFLRHLTAPGEPIRVLPDGPTLGFHLTRTEALPAGSVAAALRTGVAHEVDVDRLTFAQVTTQLEGPP
ncbi:TerD family protein [Deinococcus enclensis]|uniref:Uncharacterized protein n=1 Tax=Deinococcus enclensis TaxID=1049582 RepID=A0ABT9MBW1_9DEIO|nr:TerD family protein [Deinococcus enclensis]MDP9764050.1 hypothetical protein [Deinococcus enclensis]